jgi:ribosomal-protein-alanine N-acetyltransferase
VSGETPTLETPRLLLRRWRPEDLEAFARLNADPEVMEFFVSTLARAESDAFAGRVRDHFETHGFGLYAVELKGGTPFAGFAGLSVADFESDFTPAVEIGWRLGRASWGAGIATEAARRVLEHAFGSLELEEVVSFTVVANLRSRRVMERIGLSHDPAGDFDHPKVAEGHPLRRHVLYRLKRPAAPRLD